jgi:hypothetical protein
VRTSRIGGLSVAEHFVHFSDPVAFLFGLNGVILLAYIVAIPANEIVVPTILMLTVLVTGSPDVGQGTGVMFELDSANTTKSVLVAGGWTLLTAVNLMLFSLLHNPCSTTILHHLQGNRQRQMDGARHASSCGPRLRCDFHRGYRLEVLQLKTHSMPIQAPLDKTVQESLRECSFPDARSCSASDQLPQVFKVARP